MLSHSKKQLIDIICKDSQHDTDFPQENTEKHKLVITGQDKTPVEISVGGAIIHRYDIATTHEKAEHIIVQQAIRVANNHQRPVTVLAVLAGNTDVYTLLLYHYLEQGLQTPMMESPI